MNPFQVPIGRPSLASKKKQHKAPSFSLLNITCISPQPPPRNRASTTKIASPFFLSQDQKIASLHYTLAAKPPPTNLPTYRYYFTQEHKNNSYHPSLKPVPIHPYNPSISQIRRTRKPRSNFPFGSMDFCADGTFLPCARGCRKT